MGDWHVYTHLWTAGHMKYLLDGTVIKTSTTMVPPDTMAFVFQFEPQLTLPAAGTSVRIQVDWLTTYRYKPFRRAESAAPKPSPDAIYRDERRAGVAVWYSG